jgi:hypothetical protein
MRDAMGLDTGLEMNETKNHKKTTVSLIENRFVLRNDILLPKNPLSCIVGTNRGLRSRPESPLFTKINPATLSKLLSERSVPF